MKAASTPRRRSSPSACCAPSSSCRSRPAVKAGAYSVMPSYNEVDGVPSHANRWLLTDILRGEWGFNGLVASDYFGDRAASDPTPCRHRQGRRCRAGARGRRRSRIARPEGFPELLGLVKSGRLPESALDRSVARVLRAKFLAGCSRAPFVDPDRAERVANTPRAPGAGARGGAQVDRPAQEPGRPPAARSPRR